jgi:uncharacterized membrane protein YeaQ/YmgE (transglycosylase-associated protein family)
MTEDGIRRRARAFGVLVFVVVSVPTVLMSVALYEGAIGDAPRRGLGVMGAIVLGCIGGAAARTLAAGLRRSATDAQRTRLDVWVAAYVGTAVLTVGAFAIPIAMLLALVNSDRSLSDSRAWSFVIWTAAHILVSAAAFGTVRLVWRTTGARQSHRRSAATVDDGAL